jgi:beta-ureidopropionase
MEKAQEIEAENGEVKKVETKTLNDGSICGYDSLHSLLSENLKPELFQVIFFILPLLFFLGFSTSANFLIYMNQDR